MHFTPIYYVCIACPTIERTLEMIDQYVAHGATAFQIDMPSKDPFAETAFVKKMMADSLHGEPDYAAYMDGIREIRKRHPDIEIHIVVYNDVVDTIGLETFSAFCKAVGAASLMIPACSEENMKYLEGAGFKIFKSVIHEMSEEDIDRCVQEGPDGLIVLRNKKPGEVDRPGFETWEKKYAYLRERGVTGPIYSVFGISSKEELAAIKATGARGAIIGNVLMRLWDDEEKLWELFHAFQSLAE